MIVGWHMLSLVAVPLGVLAAFALLMRLFAGKSAPTTADEDEWWWSIK